MKKQIKKLGEICEISSGNSAPQNDDCFSGGKFPFFRTSDVGSIHISQDLSKTRDYLNEKGSKGMTLYKKKTILFPKSGASTFLNHRVMMGCDGYVSSHLATIKAKQNLIDEKYLFNFLLTVEAKDIGANSAYPSLKISDISKIEIPLPPLSEQKRIVKILDEKLGKIKEVIKIREEAIIDTEKILSKNLSEIFEEGKKKGWEDVCLENITKFIDYRGKTPTKKASGMRLITAKNVKWGYLNLEPREYVDPGIYDSWMVRGIPVRGDVLFTTEAPLANVAQLDTEEKVVFAQRIIILQPDNKRLLQKFLKYILMSDVIRNIIIEQGTGATVKGIKASKLKKIKIFTPSLSEQKQIVKKLDSLSEKIKQLKEFQIGQLSDLKRLEKSLLREAFNGELY